ncbi:MAG TPA: EAL domain-containing protein [Mycobacteriales bacterium]|nr:EAL domain-containing protein [Mycobacteriales bacterium]
MSGARLPGRARALIGVIVAAALTAVALAGLRLATTGVGSIAALAVLAVLFVLSNRFPLLLYGANYSEAVSFDDGLLAVTIAMLPLGSVVVMMAATQLAAQLWRRRQPIKAAFNTAQFTVSATGAVLVADAVGRTPGAVTPTLALAIVLGTVTFIAINSLLVGLLLNFVARQPLRAVWEEGREPRLLLVTTGLIAGTLCGVASASYHWLLVAVPLVFLLLRQMLTGHFEARRDRDRILGLLDAARDIHGAMARGKVRETLEAAASRLLRGAAQVQVNRPDDSAPTVALPDGSGWLTVTDRNPGEPFDDADEHLLKALATIGSGAFINSTLFGQVRGQRRQMETVLSSLAEGVCAFDADGRPTFWNAAAESLLKLGIEEFSPVHPVAERLLAPVRRCLQTGTPLDASTTLLRADGTTLPVSYTCALSQEHGRPTGVVLAFRDDTERLNYEVQLAHHAFHDQLTGLPNRRLFLDRLDHALARTGREPRRHAVLFADVDRFKLINDSLGHQAGDRLLVEIAQRLRTVVRAVDTVARFGGDEFTVLIEDIDDVTDIQAMAERVVQAMEPPIQVAPQRSIVATLSIGIALSRPDATGDDLLHDADLAMYEAKTEGLGRWQQYRGGGDHRPIEQLDLEVDLRNALASGAIDVFFQPLVNPADDRPADAEALVRWRHPTRGWLAPSDFIPIAEETGLVLPLGRLVLREACRQCRRWETEYGVRVGVSVNLSARQFQDISLVEDVRDALERAGLPPQRLCLEITETLAMRDIDWTIGTLRRLKEVGVRVAIDDFGTGHSSLNYLKRFPVDVVKIDGSFVQDIDTSVVDNAIVAAVVMLAETLHITTVAERVERPSQLSLLRDLGCALVQGYLYARPMPADEIGDWLVAAARGVRLPAQRRDQPHDQPRDPTTSTIMALATPSRGDHGVSDALTP